MIQTIRDRGGVFARATIFALSLLTLLTVATFDRATAAGPLFDASSMWVDGRLPLSVVIADLNGDGRPDLAATGSGGVFVHLAREDATYGDPAIYPTGPAATAVAAGDLNGDARPDLVIVNLQANSLFGAARQGRRDLLHGGQLRHAVEPGWRGAR